MPEMPGNPKPGTNTSTTSSPTPTIRHRIIGRLVTMNCKAASIRFQLLSVLLDNAMVS